MWHRHKSRFCCQRDRSSQRAVQEAQHTSHVRTRVTKANILSGCRENCSCSWSAPSGMSINQKKVRFIWRQRADLQNHRQFAWRTEITRKNAVKLQWLSCCWWKKWPPNAIQVLQMHDKQSELTTHKIVCVLFVLYWHIRLILIITDSDYN